MRFADRKKDFLLIGLVVAGGLAIGNGLLTRNRIADPVSQLDAEQLAAIPHAVQELDAAFERTWQQAELQVAEPANELTVYRRLGLGLAGTVPSLEEIRHLESLPSTQRVNWWIQRLLADERTADYLAERLTRALVGVEDGPFLVYRRRRFRDWLAGQIQENRPYDELVRDILTEEGIWTDTPSVNFVTRTISEDNEQRPDEILLAGRTSRAFLGMRIDCLQCHDDFLGTINLGTPDQLRSGTQADFHSLASFFSQTDNSILGIRDDPTNEPYRYQLLDEPEPKVIPAKAPFLSALDDGQGPLRSRLARWVTHPENRPFARAIVNRMWAIMSGRPLVQPVDDIPLEGPFPAALEFLAEDFVEHDFNLHRLIHIIAQSRAFQLDSGSDFEITSAHLRHWSAFPLSRLRPDQASGAIAQSTQLTTLDATSHILSRLTQFGQQNDFVERFGDPGEDEFEDRGETVTQRLLMLNGEMITERLQNELNSSGQLVGLSPNANTTVDVVYLSTLTRYPTDEEREHFAQSISDRPRNERAAEVIDLYWSLLNSAEFRWNH